MEQQEPKEQHDDTDHHWSLSELYTLHPSLIAVPPSLPSTVRDNLLLHPQQTLLHLAKFFRNQSELMLQQATVLEQMALDRDDGTIRASSSSSSSLQTHLQQTSLTTRINKTVVIMESVHARLDAMELQLLKPKGDTASCVTAYGVFQRDQFPVAAERVGTTRPGIVGKELSQMWKDVTQEKKEECERQAAVHFRAREMKRKWKELRKDKGRVR